MSNNPLAVKMECPFTYADEYVYFYPVEHEGQWYVSFNGCDNSWHKCDECEACRKNAYAKLIKAE